MKKSVVVAIAMFSLRAALILGVLSILQQAPFAQGQNLDSAAPENPDVCTPVWAAGPNLPSATVRAVGVYFPTNGLFYVMGGRASDTAGSDFTHPFEYSPSSNSWTTKAATYPDLQVNNMACAILTDAGTPYIYCVGGSQAGQTTAAMRVFRYNPVTDTISAVAAPWPGNTGGNVLPGGFAVVSNKLYILGGFQINTAMTNQIWEFTPGTNVWVQKTSVLPVLLGYVPTAAVGTLIYTAGGSTFTAPSTLADSNNSYKYDPVADVITTITNIPRATGETRALNLGGKVYVMGGGRTAPNPSTQVDIYDPGAGTWTTGSPFAAVRRNFPTDTDGSRIWLGGGYDATVPGTAQNTMEIYQCPATSVSTAVARKTHGGAGNMDIDLPLTGTTGVECRSGGATNDFTMVVNFAGNVTVSGSPQAQVTSGTGTIGTGGVSNGGAVTVAGNVVTIPLTSVADQQTINVTLNGVNAASADQPAVNVVIPMSRLLGDTNGNRAVNASDVTQTKGRIGQAVTSSNFRSDVNANGSINAGDVSIAKGNTGHAVP